MLVALLVLMEVGINPFGSLAPDRPWSRCGSDLCACTPLEPACPLCPDPAESGECTTADCGEGVGTGLVRRAERLDGSLPMLWELLTASLVIGVGGDGPSIEPPREQGLVACIGIGCCRTGGIAIEPPPPRGDAPLA